MNPRFTCEQGAKAALGEPTKHTGAELLWHCPRHEDKHESLSVNPKKNAWLCGPCGASGNAWALAAFLAGCDPSDKPAVKTWLKEHGLLYEAGRRGKAYGRGPCVEVYVYSDADGNPVARKLRFEPGADGRPKDFSWQRLNGAKWIDGLGGVKTGLYRIAEIKDSDSVVITEGEKDADAGAKLRLPTCTSGGINSWCEDHAECLRGKAVVIIPDADEPGRAHAQKVAASLFGKAASVKVCEIPGAKDLAEAIEKGLGRDALLALFADSREWKPATGAEILESVMHFVRRFLSITESEERVKALWVAHTHAIDAADYTPYLNVTSAEKESGKTRLLDVAKLLVSKPWKTENASPAAMVRKIHSGFEKGEHVTLLFDERDSQTGGDRERAETVRGILNSGYQRGGCYSRCVGEGTKMRVMDFQTFGPKVLAGIGALTDTVASRSIPIAMKRARRGKVERFRERDVSREGSEIKAKLAAWASINLEKLRAARPEIPGELSDRQADVCEPLLAIADAAGGEWPESARAAILELCAGARAVDDSVGAKLLADCYRIFYPHDDDGKALPPVERIASEDLAKELGEMEGRPWAEWKAGKPITKNQLAGRLARFDIESKPMRLPDGRRLRGYEREQFHEAWELYLPADSHLPTTSKRDTVTTRINTGENGDSQSVTPGSCHASENAVSANKDAPCHGVTVEKQRKGEEKAREERKKVEVEWEA